MQKLLRLVSVFLFTLFLSPFTLAETPDPDCPLDFFYLGYDLVKGNPANDGADPGWSGPVMKRTLIESSIFCSYSDACSGSYETHDMDTELDYYNSLFFKVYLSTSSEDFLKSTAFTGSEEYFYQQEDVFGLGFINVQAEGECQIFKGGRHPSVYDVSFHEGFLNDIANFPTSMDDPEWFNKNVLPFFEFYGTHILGDEVSLGARWSYESLFTQASYDAMRAANVDIAVAAEASAEFLRTEEASIINETEEITEMRLMFDGSSASKRAIFVGAPPPEDLRFAEWANNIDNPIPQKFNLKPISELLTPDYFPDDPDIGKKRAIMEAGYLLYCDAVPGCHVPEPPKIIQVYNTDKGLYETRNSLSASCPEDYQLISGGCKSEPQPKEPLYWNIPLLKPEGNTYHCTVNMDYTTDSGSKNYYRGLDTTATCLYKDYIKERVITTCDGDIGYKGSECIALCPSGFVVTGGGCESNSLDETWPWKVTRSSPVYNANAQSSGWSCRVTKDYGEGQAVKDRKAHGYAVCVQYAENVVEDQKIITKNSGTFEEMTNGSTAICEIGYEVLSGGCIVPYHEESSYEWKTVETQPSKSEQGWSCLAQRDKDSGTSNQDVQTDALCIKFKKYIANE